MEDIYFTQEIDILPSSPRFIWLEEKHLHTKTTSHRRSFRDMKFEHGHFACLPFANMEGFGISNNGILMNIPKNILYIPKVKEFKSHPLIPDLMVADSAQYYIKGFPGLYDMAELVLASRFRVNPENFKIDYSIGTDGDAIFIYNFEITFKEPEFFLIPKTYDFLAAKFYDDYFISRDYNHQFFISRNGAVYDAINNKFCPIYFESFKSADKHRMMVPIIYMQYGREYLLQQVVEHWSGVKIPRGLTVVNTSNISGNASLDSFRIEDFRMNNVPAIKIADVVNRSRDKLEKRHNQLIRTRTRVESGIESTKKILNLAYNRHLKHKPFTI